MNERQKNKLIFLSKRLRKIAAPVGPLHSFWDPISDIESFIIGKPTILKKSAEEWIEYAEELLKD